MTEDSGKGSCSLTSLSFVMGGRYTPQDARTSLSSPRAQAGNEQEEQVPGHEEQLGLLARTGEVALQPRRCRDLTPASAGTLKEAGAESGNEWGCVLRDKSD